MLDYIKLHEVSILVELYTELSGIKRQHSQINNLTMNLRVLEKQEQSRHQSRSHQEIIIGQTENSERTV